MFSEAIRVLLELLQGDKLPKTADVGFRTVDKKAVQERWQTNLVSHSESLVVLGVYKSPGPSCFIFFIMKHRAALLICVGASSSRVRHDF